MKVGALHEYYAEHCLMDPTEYNPLPPTSMAEIDSFQNTCV
jgi:hypothetical protein